MKLQFNWEDVSQVLVGAFSLAVPVAFTEEAWDLGETLPFKNLVFVVSISIAFLALFAYQSVFSGNVRNRVLVFVLRVFLAYLLAVLTVCLVLLALNRFPIMTQPTVALRRVLIIGMPASMGAIIVDSFDKE